MDMKNSPLSTLNDPGLLKTDALVGGAWVSGKARFAVHDPATGLKLVDVANLGAPAAQDAITAANQAWPAWRNKTAKERAAILMKWFHLLHQHADDLARIMTAEQGKPLAEAKGEVGYGASFLEWFAEEARRVYGETVPTTDNNKRYLVIKQPVGVCAAITPWNFPIAMITRKVAPGPGRGLPGDHQAGRTDAAVGPGRGRAGPARRHAAGRAERAHRRRRQLHCHRQGAVRQRRGAPPVVHRLHRGRAHPRAAMCADDQEALVGARWQRPIHRVRRCRPRQCRRGAR